jgi:YHS domain-containing protein
MTMQQYRKGLAFAVWFLLLLLIIGVRSPAFAGSSPVPVVNAKDGVGLKGYDPVAYFVNGQPTKGVQQYSLVWKGVSYRFASQENLNRFKADPDKYLPQYGGYCAYAMSLNRIADIDPSRWAVVDGKLYLNNGYLAQALWSRNKRGNIDSADQNWPNYPKQLEGK